MSRWPSLPEVGTEEGIIVTIQDAFKNTLFVFLDKDGQAENTMVVLPSSLKGQVKVGDKIKATFYFYPGVRGKQMGTAHEAWLWQNEGWQKIHGTH